MTIMPNIVVVAQTPEQSSQAQKLAEHLNLPYVGVLHDQNHLWALIQQEDRIALRFPGATKPFSVDFIQGSNARRLQQAGRVREPLARAVGLKPGLRITDGTAGWGADAMLLARLGAEVVALERSPIVATLLLDGIERALHHPLFAKVSLKVQLADSLDVLQNLSPAPEVIYLDPMFPERPNSALVKKPLQLLQMLLGDATDEEELLLKAMASATDRVVVKRPNWAEPLAKAPSFSVPGGIVRFDVYKIS